MQSVIRLFFSLTVSTVLICCSNSPDKKNERTTGAPGSFDEPAFKNKIIESLKDLHSVLASKDKNAIAAIFSFPLPEEDAELSANDPALANKIKQNNGRISKDIFLDYFETFYHSLNMARIINVLEEADTDSLLYTNQVTKEITNNLLPCTSYYTVELDKESVTLEFGTNTNSEYAAGNSSSADSDVDGCEYMTRWLLKFDGEKLAFNKQVSAG